MLVMRLHSYHTSFYRFFTALPHHRPPFHSHVPSCFVGGSSRSCSLSSRRILSKRVQTKLQHLLGHCYPLIIYVPSPRLAYGPPLIPSLQTPSLSSPVAQLLKTNSHTAAYVLNGGSSSSLGNRCSTFPLSNEHHHQLCANPDPPLA